MTGGHWHETLTVLTNDEWDDLAEILVQWFEEGLPVAATDDEWELARKIMTAAGKEL